MRKYIVERDIEGLGELTPEELGYVARESNAALANMVGIQWVHSYVTGAKAFDVFLAESEELIREHAIVAGFPTTAINEVVDTMDPTSASWFERGEGTTSRQIVRSWISRNTANSALMFAALSGII